MEGGIRAVNQLFQQIADGWDIPKPGSVLKGIRPSETVRDVPGLPYTFLTNLFHTVMWQNYWLSRLQGAKKKPNMELWKGDWPTPNVEEFQSLRQQFLDGFEKARSIAGSQPFQHGCESDDEAVALLLQIAIHASYHLGQMNLIKRTLRATAQKTTKPS